MLRLVEGLRGRFLVDDVDGYVGRSLVRYGEYGEAQARLFDGLVGGGDVVVDVGANIGAHTVVFGKLGARVYAFEPQRRCYHMLCANLSLNGLDYRVVPFRLACGAERGSRQIDVLDETVEGNNHGAFSIERVTCPQDSVEVVQLQMDCDFLKIDVEGYELEVLKGARDMIRRCRPVMYVENDREERSDALLGFLGELGYRCYWHITPLYRSDNHAGEAQNVFGIESSYDMLCYPDRRACELAPAVAGSHPLRRERMVS